MYPIIVLQAVKLGGNSQAGGLLTARGTGTAVAAVGDVFNISAVEIIAAILFHAGDAGAAGEYFGDGPHFDIAQTANVEKGCPALISRKECLERAWGKTGRHGAD